MLVATIALNVKDMALTFVCMPNVYQTSVEGKYVASVDLVDWLQIYHETYKDSRIIKKSLAVCIAFTESIRTKLSTCA